MGEVFAFKSFYRFHCQRQWCTFMFAFVYRSFTKGAIKCCIPFRFEQWINLKWQFRSSSGWGFKRRANELKFKFMWEKERELVNCIAWIACWDIIEKQPTFISSILIKHRNINNCVLKSWAIVTIASVGLQSNERIMRWVEPNMFWHFNRLFIS